MTQSIHTNLPPITCMVPAFNEERRIGAVMSHAVAWADEVVVIDKSSTDGTARIAESFGPKVQVARVPFSGAGDDRLELMAQRASHDWIFLTTCSEVPTRRLIAEVRSLLNRDGESVDVVYVPRRMYSFGIHSKSSPWNVAYYPFLYHRERAQFPNIVHDHIRPRDPARSRTIPYSDDCCVYHLTHVSAQAFVQSHMEYARLEAKAASDPDTVIRESLQRFSDAAPGICRSGTEWPMIFAAWGIYNLLNVLFACEKRRGVDVVAYYEELSQRLLASQWGVAGKPPGDITDECEAKRRISHELCAADRDIAANCHRTVAVAYMAANLLYYAGHPAKIIPAAWSGGKRFAKNCARVLRTAFRKLVNHRR